MKVCKTSLKIWLGIISSLAVVFLGIVLCLYFSNFSGPLSTKQDDWAAFGSYVGGSAGAVLSFLALIALLLTIYIQSKELSATREELQRSAKAQEQSKEALAQQAKVLGRQQFEQTFFSLLEQHNLVLRELYTVPKERKDQASDMQILSRIVLDQHTVELARNVLKKNNHVIGHYFRLLYQLLKFIYTNSISDGNSRDFNNEKIVETELAESEKMYSNIVRSFIDNPMSQLLAINCYCNDEKDNYWKYRLLLERYSFLEHMPFGENQVYFQLCRSYDESVFGESSNLKDYKNSVFYEMHNNSTKYEESF